MRNMEKIVIAEDFYYSGEKIEKGTLVEVFDAKKGFSRSGILVEITFPLKEKTAKDWVDVAMIYPMKEEFTLPRGTTHETIQQLRDEKLCTEDKKLYESWKEMIDRGENHKVIKSIITRNTSEKFGI